MVILPNKFDAYQLLLDFDRSSDFLNWFAFLDVANSVFHGFHSWVQSAGHWYRYQCFPILSICFPDQLLETKGVVPPFAPVIFPGPLTNHPVLLEENRWDIIDNMEADDASKRAVRFFLPALIWGYNELKKALLYDEVAISNADFDVDLQHFAAMSNPDATELPVSKGLR